MRDWVSEALGALDAGEPLVSVQVTKVRGSAPREPGTTMLVLGDRCIGTIGGGQLEYGAIRTAREILRAGEEAHVQRRIPLGSGCGQCCGGIVTLDFALWTAASRDRLLEQPRPPGEHVVIFGAGHVGRALAQVLGTLDVDILVVDSRAEQLALLAEGAGSPLLAAHPPEVARHCPEGASVIVMTHDHDLDFELCSTLLQRTDWRFLGLIGSRTKARRFARRLLAAGFTEFDLQRLTCPIGLPGIGGKQPGEIAIAVAAQILGASARQSLQGVA